ncbi:hypothetical protein E1265_21365 [Streptomyces sp. 8K308]|uniref:hypothetical protein n=1 Tax=Streptomyces sp. 8K308 TaxID=2530388 RepID=UPI0010533E2B|nr:hypothetical protein [Streptomyces sp. 8K308]TDC20622.1 hypothetical protein E1265_21365 [Streptomyces sp. 8K308]
MPRLTPAQIARVAKDAGFSGNALQIAVAVALGESGGRTDAHNAVPPDNSYGLWQINMLGSLGPARRRQFGLSSNNELFNASTNARAAYAISSRGTNFRPWSVYTNGTYRMHMNRAADGVRGVGGAVVPETGGGGGGASSIGDIQIGSQSRQIDFTGEDGTSQINLSFGLDLFNWFRRLAQLPGAEELAGQLPLFGPIVSAIGSITDLMMVWTTALVKGAAWVANPDNWVRVVQVVVGGVLVISGASISARPFAQPIVSGVQGVATTVATRGAAGKGGK